MKLGLLILLITSFFVANTYYDGKLFHIIKGWKKYYKMAFIAFSGICAYVFIKRNPQNTRELFTHANNFVKHMPIDRDAGNMLTPLLDFTSNSFFNESGISSENSGYGGGGSRGYGGGYGGGYGASGGGYGGGDAVYTPQQKRMLNSGGKSTKRCVSETKKKFVAAQQGWTCDHCKCQLPAWFEVDHITRLEYGGSNHVDNLVALCRNCHGKKTALENL